MSSTRAVGDSVHTPLGKGVIREVRNGRRLLVEVNGRAVLFDAKAIASPEAGRKSAVKKRSAPPPEFTPHSASPTARRAPGEIDLHGLTVEEALACAERAISDALLDNRLELRLIHGQSGGRIRAALHRRLREISSVRGFRLDPRNPGVTIVSF